jgi:TetR/AcrR family transcriptional regulator, transcriptional repressor for nem operon
VRDVFSGYQKYFERTLGDAAASGRLRETDVRGLAQAVLAYFQGALLLAKTHNDASVIDRLADHAITLVLGTDRNLEPA